MAQISGVEELVERRHLLVRESQRLRQQVADEAQNLRPVVAWAEWGYLLAQSVLSFWPVAGGVAAFLFTRRKRSWLGKIGKLWSWWRAGKKLLELWRTYSSKSKNPPNLD